MSKNHIEYDRDVNPYPCSGKKYNGEKAIISLTSWKARIRTVVKTLYSLIKHCSDFHIVLVLSEEEFPKREKELPEKLMLFVENELIEILWVYKNYKSFKKVLFTMDKYRDVPVISADDDCFYTCNYAGELYNTWKANPSLNAIRYEFGRKLQMQGPTSLYYLPKNMQRTLIDMLDDTIIRTGEDDAIIYRFMKLLHCKFGFVHRHIKKPYIFHDTISPLHSDASFKAMPEFRNLFV